MDQDPPETASPVIWRDDGLPASRLYGDVYFSSEDGLAETRAVFLAGCGLPEAWVGRTRFTVGELGFGSGLNIAALLTLWAETRPAGARLHIFSIEAHPMSADDARRALSRWPQIAPAAEALLAAWPGQAKGFHRYDLPDFGATLDVAVMEASAALEQWTGAADAWFLDGFAPAANPAMWSEEVMALVATRTAPGGRAATFTVAGAVRRGLAAAGFAVSKEPGFGRKRERLEARMAGEPAKLQQQPPGPVAVIGAGIAGAAMARALAQEGLNCRVFDPLGPAAAASGNAAALMTPRLDAGDGPPAGLFAQAFARARTLYDQVPGAVLSRGALHLSETPKDDERFARIAGGDLFEPGEMTAGPRGLEMTSAMVLSPAAIINRWVGAVETIGIESLRATADGAWELMGSDGEVLMTAASVVICGGHRSGRLATGVNLQPVRGQASLAQGATLDQAISFGAYAVPAPGGVLFGASHQRDDADADLRPQDDLDNVERIAARLPDLAAQLAARPLTGRAGIRAATADHLPLAGPAPQQPGLFLLSGLGGRGFCLAPLMAEHIVAAITGAPSPLPDRLAGAVDPARFALRAARRQGGQGSGRVRDGASQTPPS